MGLCLNVTESSRFATVVRFGEMQASKSVGQKGRSSEGWNRWICRQIWGKKVFWQSEGVPCRSFGVF